jgi:hypothetical protein
MRMLAGARGYVARWRLGRLPPGRYVLTASAVDAHGAGAARSVALSVGA